VSIGAQVRVTSSALARRIQGVVIGADSDTLTVASGESPTTVPVASIRRLELRTGSKRHVWQGLLIGAALGALVGVAEKEPNCSLDGSDTRGECTAYYAMGMGLLGLGVGALVKTDTWTALALPGRSAVTGRGWGIRFALSF
jgi:hypothetical protein